MASSKISGSPVVIETGTSGIWTYRKWSDGTAECWGKYQTSGTFTAWGSWYSTDIAPIDFPSGLFSETPALHAQAKCSGGNTISSINATGLTKDQAGGLTIARGASLSGSQTLTAYYYAIGKWR